MASSAWRVETSEVRIGCSSRPVAYQVVASLTKIGVQATVYHFEDDRWVLYERVEAGTPSLAAADARWQALKDWLAEQAAGGGIPAVAFDIEGHAYGSVLAKMAELEAGQ